jgi:hypothetical protein
MRLNSLNNDKKAEPIEVKRTTSSQIVAEAIAEKLQRNWVSKQTSENMCAEEYRAMIEIAKNGSEDCEMCGS